MPANGLEKGKIDGFKSVEDLLSVPSTAGRAVKHLACRLAFVASVHAAVTLQAPDVNMCSSLTCTLFAVERLHMDLSA